MPELGWPGGGALGPVAVACIARSIWTLVSFVGWFRMTRLPVPGVTWMVGVILICASCISCFACGFAGLLLHLLLHLLLRLVHSRLDLIESGHAIGFLVEVDRDHATPVEVDDLRRSVGVVGAQAVALDVVRCAGRLQRLLLLLLGVSAREDRRELHHADQCAAGDLRRFGIFEVGACGSGWAQEQEDGAQNPDGFHGELLSWLAGLVWHLRRAQVGLYYSGISRFDIRQWFLASHTGESQYPSTQITVFSQGGPECRGGPAPSSFPGSGIPFADVRPASDCPEESLRAFSWLELYQPCEKHQRPGLGSQKAAIPPRRVPPDDLQSRRLSALPPRGDGYCLLVDGEDLRIAGLTNCHLRHSPPLPVSPLGNGIRIQYLS